MWHRVLTADMDARPVERLRPKRSLGQNFLRDENIARKIVAAVRPGPEDVLLEIGPGGGALTRHLVPLVRRLILVELDQRAVARLAGEFPQSHVQLIHGDILETDLHRLAARSGVERGGLRIVGNIPYFITSQIVLHVLEQWHCVRDCTFMMQKEVARRLAADPGTKEYGILSVFCRLVADVRVLFDVSPNAFTPRPRVVSSVVSFTMLSAPRHEVRDEPFFRTMVRGVFGKRRKTLANGLRYLLGPDHVDLPPWVDGRRRAEEFSVGELVALANALAPGGRGQR